MNGELHLIALTIQAVRYTSCPDRSWLGSLYDYGHGEPIVTEHHARIRGPWLTVRLPASTQVRLTLTLTLRTRPPSYTTPFDEDLQGLQVPHHARLKNQFIRTDRRTRQTLL